MSSAILHVSISELCERESVSHSLVVELVDHDIARPIEGTSAQKWVFDATGAHWVKKAIRLHRDLELDWIAVAVLIDLLRQKEQLQGENRLLKQRLQRFLSEG